jgi:hypothetical protein
VAASSARSPDPGAFFDVDVLAPSGINVVGLDFNHLGTATFVHTDVHITPTDRSKTAATMSRTCRYRRRLAVDGSRPSARMKVREVLRMLKDDGWNIAGQRGSHRNGVVRIGSVERSRGASG